jgi:hypothetical protein
MKFIGKINKLFLVSKNLKDKEKNFNKGYYKLYDGRHRIAKDIYILNNAFNIDDNAKNENNEINPKEYLQEDKIEKYKFNIHNFESSLKIDKSKKLSSLNDVILKKLLFKISRKNIEEILKKKEEKINFQNLTLKGIRKKSNLSKTFNSSISVQSYYNLSGNKNNNNDSTSFNFNTTSKISKTKNSFSYDTFNKTRKELTKYEPKTTFNFNYLNHRLKDIFQNINSEEKNILINSEFMKTDFKKFRNNNRYKSKTINTEKIRKPKFILKNKEEANIFNIKNKKDLEFTLFKNYESTFNKARNKLFNLYQSGKKKDID